ncbi:hypothetical protein GWI33_017117, partial [Rhynchophorus ferrugineus]
GRADGTGKSTAKNPKRAAASEACDFQSV